MDWSQHNMHLIPFRTKNSLEIYSQEKTVKCMRASRVKGSCRGCIFLVQRGQFVGVKWIYTVFIQTSYWPLEGKQCSKTQDWKNMCMCVCVHVCDQNCIFITCRIWVAIESTTKIELNRYFGKMYAWKNIFKSRQTKFMKTAEHLAAQSQIIPLGGVEHKTQLKMNDHFAL